MSIRISPPPLLGLDLTSPDGMTSALETFAARISRSLNDGLRAAARRTNVPTNEGRLSLDDLRNRLAQPGDIKWVYLTWGEALAMEGWAICDGRNGTPKIHPLPGDSASAAFVRGVTWGSSVSRSALGRDGGCSSHTHTISITGGAHTHTVSIPNHDHDIDDETTENENAHTHAIANDNIGAHTHTIANCGCHCHCGYTDSVYQYYSCCCVSPCGSFPVCVPNFVDFENHTHSIAVENHHNHGGASGSVNPAAHNHGGASGAGTPHAHDVTGITTDEAVVAQQTSSSTAPVVTASLDTDDSAPPYVGLIAIMKL